MNFTLTETVKLEICESNDQALEDALFEALRRISLSCRKVGTNTIETESVNATFGSILRNDNTSVSFRPNRRKDGYLIEALVHYRPSVWFWVFFAIDILLIETVIGFVVGMAMTLGLYFYNKKVVTESLTEALKSAAREIE